MSLAANIKRRRKEFGWSQPKLAEVSDVPQSSISNIETERNNSATLEVLIRLANALQVSIDWLADRDSAPPDDRDVALARKIATLPEGIRSVFEELVIKTQELNK